MDWILGQIARDMFLLFIRLLFLILAFVGYLVAFFWLWNRDNWLGKIIAVALIIGTIWFLFFR